jgi:hypothetical protein
MTLFVGLLIFAAAWLLVGTWIESLIIKRPRSSDWIGVLCWPVLVALAACWAVEELTKKVKRS